MKTRFLGSYMPVEALPSTLNRFVQMSRRKLRRLAVTVSLLKYPLHRLIIFAHAVDFKVSTDYRIQFSLRRFLLSAEVTLSSGLRREKKLPAPKSTARLSESKGLIWVDFLNNFGYQRRQS